MKKTLEPFVGQIVKVAQGTDDKGNGGFMQVVAVDEETVTLNNGNVVMFSLDFVVGVMPCSITEKLGSTFGKKQEITAVACVWLSNGQMFTPSGKTNWVNELVGGASSYGGLA